VSLVVLALQTQCQSDASKCGPDTEKIAGATLFGLVWSCRLGSIPTTATASGCTGVVVFLDICLLVGMSAILLAEPQDSHDALKGRPGAAEEAEEQEQNDAENHADNDTGDGSSAKTSAAASHGLQRAIDTRGDGRLERHRGCWGSCDDDQGRARRAQRCGRGQGSNDATRGTPSNQGALRDPVVEAVVSSGAACASTSLLRVAAKSRGRGGGGSRCRSSDIRAVDDGLCHQVRLDHGRRPISP
jgi:hypothetical protein